MTKNKNPISKVGNTTTASYFKKLQKSRLSGFWNISGISLSKEKVRDNLLTHQPKPINISLNKFAKQ
jgi:hypothetical protein